MAMTAMHGLGRRVSATDGFIPIVDVLRAVAIVAVVVYHAAPGVLPGGFIGVDVFFVVSGFLILGQIGTALQTGTFSLIGFFKRRALRILPPYLIVVAASAAAACIILLTPQDLQDFQRDLTWSGAFAGNILYARVLNYFDDAVARHVLLHLWSLAVEEQFYIVAPLVLLALFALAGAISQRRRTALVLGAGAVFAAASFVACLIVAVEVSPQEAFYQTPLRLWEFLAGGGVRAALPLFRNLPAWARDCAVVLGLALIVAATITSGESGYPGWLTLLPVGAAAMVIAAGAGHNGGLVVKALATPAVLFIGLVSYELYLWHWPVLVLARAANFGELSFVQSLSCIAGALVLAAATHFALARSVAGLRRASGRKTNLLILATTLAGYAAIIFTLSFGVGVAARSAAEQVPPLLVPKMESRSECNILRPQSVTSACAISEVPGRTGLLLGDSHAGNNFAVFREHARAVGAALVFADFPGCAPFLTVARRQDANPANCRRWKSEVRQGLGGNAGRYDFAILSSQWVFHSYDLVGPDQETAFKAGLRADLDLLAEAGVRRVLIIGAPPVMRRQPADCIIRADRFGFERDEKCSLPRARYDGRVTTINAWIRAVIAGDDSAVRFADPAASFCNDQWCSPAVGDVSLYVDHSHLSRAGTEALATAAGRDLEWVLSGQAP